MVLLKNTFDKRLVIRFTALNWPSHSPDLTTPDNSQKKVSWGHLKERAYENKPATIQEFKIPTEIRALQVEIFRNVMENAFERAHLCEGENGGQLKDVIFWN